MVTWEEATNPTSLRFLLPLPSTDDILEESVHSHAVTCSAVPLLDAWLVVLASFQYGGLASIVHGYHLRIKGNSRGSG